MPVKILSIDGGGTRGLFPATILTKLEQDLGKPVTEIFDVIIGSATGGIIATSLAAGLSAQQIQSIYLNEAKDLLPKNIWRQFFLFNPINLFRAKYTNKGVYAAMKKHIGETQTLHDVFHQYGEKPIFLMPTLDLTPFLGAKEIPGFRPIVYNSASKADKGITLIDIAMRTSSAAINLPVYQKYSEGGSYANDPCVFGLSFALQSDPDTEQTLQLQNQKLGLAKTPDEIKLFSIGCGSDGNSYVPQDKLKKKDWGFLKWSKYLVNLVIDTNMVANQYLTKEILPKENYLRINAYYRDESAPEILRKTKKLRIDVTDPEQLKAIKEFATSVYDVHRNEILTFIQ